MQDPPRTAQCSACVLKSDIEPTYAMVLATGQATMPAIREVLTRELEQAPIDCVSAFCMTCRQCRWIANHPTYSEACTEALWCQRQLASFNQFVESL